MNFQLADGTRPYARMIEERVAKEGVVSTMNGCRFVAPLQPGCVNLDRFTHEKTEVFVTPVILFALGHNDYWLSVLEREAGKFFYFERDRTGNYRYTPGMPAPDPELDRALLAVARNLVVIDQAKMAQLMREELGPLEARQAAMDRQQQEDKAMQDAMLDHVKAKFGQMDSRASIHSVVLAFICIVGTLFLWAGHLLLDRLLRSEAKQAAHDTQIGQHAQKLGQHDQKLEQHDQELGMVRTQIEMLVRYLTNTSSPPPKALPPAPPTTSVAVYTEPPNAAGSVLWFLCKCVLAVSVVVVMLVKCFISRIHEFEAWLDQPGSYERFQRWLYIIAVVFFAVIIKCMGVF